MKQPALRLVLIITSDTAFLEINKAPSLIRAIQGLRESWPTLPLTVCVRPENSSETYPILEKNRVAHELLVCEVNFPAELAKALGPDCQNYEGIIFHDASRPFTSSEQSQRLIETFTEYDAVRPAIAFTETLKIVGSGGSIKQTIDRTKVKRISTPEIIRTSAIDPNGKDAGWMVPLKKGAKTHHVEGSPEGLRINSVAERDLLESFLHWKQTSS